MRKLRNKLMLSAGAVTVLSGAGVAVASHSAGASTIILEPIVAPLLHILAFITLL
jgi:hypothetical protein